MAKHQWLSCKSCGIRFHGHPARVYCSDLCQRATWVEHECFVCGVGFCAPASWKVCGERCRKLMRSRKVSAKARGRRADRRKYGKQMLAKVHRHLGYDPATGFIWWKVPSSAGTPEGSEAGVVRKASSSLFYRYIGLGGFLYQAAHIAHVLHEGRWVDEGMVIDHINGDGLDNRWENLRVIDHRGNMLNRKGHRDGFYGCLPGVIFVEGRAGKKKFRSRFMLNGKKVHVGWFEDEIEAHEAYKKAIGEL